MTTPDDGPIPFDGPATAPAAEPVVEPEPEAAVGDPGTPAKPNCPHDDFPLVNVREERNAFTPPWMCEQCARAWWPSQLTPPARKAWDREFASYRADVASQAHLASARRDQAMQHKG